MVTLTEQVSISSLLVYCQPSSSIEKKKSIQMSLKEKLESTAGLENKTKMTKLYIYRNPNKEAQTKQAQQL